MKSSSRVSGIFLLAVFAALMLAAAGTVQAQSIAVHYSDYAGSGYSGIVGTDGVVPNGYWTNVSVNWFSGSASNLVDSTDAVTTAATNVNNGVTGGGTYWWVNGPAGGVDNLLEGPWGGDGGGGAEAIPSVITGIPYANYEIIAYSNPPYPGEHSIWLDGNPASSSAYNAPVAGSQYYYNQDSTAFDLITSQASASPSTGNYVVWTGLSGPIQTIWDGGVGGATNEGVSGFEIVNTSVTTPEPSTLVLLGVGAIGLIGIAWRKRRAA